MAHRDGEDASPDWPATAEPLGDKVFDDRFDQGYPAAQVFAPAGETVICFEPMAAPTDALRRGGYRSARPGEPDTAVFSIKVS
jgi:aldose 1-epimerase